MTDPVATVGTSRAISGADQDQNSANLGALVSNGRPVDDPIAEWRQDHAEVAAIELVIARNLGSWLLAPLHAAQIYAEGLLTGAVTVATDVDHWVHVPAAMGHASYEEHEADGFRWTLDAEAWQISIRSLHGLAHGVIEHDEADEPYGDQTALCMSWYVRGADLKGTDLTLDDVAAAFAGDVLAAARAFLRACEVLPVR